MPKKPQDDTDWIMQALVWAREQVEPPLSVAGMARQLGMHRTTYDSYEKGKARPKETLFDQIAELRGLPKGWHKKQFPKRTEAAHSKTERPYVRPLPYPAAEIPCIGPITAGRLRDEKMQRTQQPIQLPAQMAGPSLVCALADANDSNMEFPHGSILIFDTEKRHNAIGKRVGVTPKNGECSSVRFIAWDADRNQIIYRSYVGARDLTAAECDEDGLLVGNIRVNRPGKFSGDFDSDDGI